MEFLDAIKSPMMCTPCARSQGVYKLICVLGVRLKKNLIDVCHRVSLVSSVPDDTKASIGRNRG